MGRGHETFRVAAIRDRLWGRLASSRAFCRTENNVVLVNKSIFWFFRELYDRREFVLSCLVSSSIRLSSGFNCDITTTQVYTHGRKVYIFRIALEPIKSTFHRYQLAVMSSQEQNCFSSSHILWYRADVWPAWSSQVSEVKASNFISYFFQHRLQSRPELTHESIFPLNSFKRSRRFSSDSFVCFATI